MIRLQVISLTQTMLAKLAIFVVFVLPYSYHLYVSNYCLLILLCVILLKLFELSTVKSIKQKMLCRIICIYCTFFLFFFKVFYLWKLKVHGPNVQCRFHLLRLSPSIPWGSPPYSHSLYFIFTCNFTTLYKQNEMFLCIHFKTTISTKI